MGDSKNFDDLVETALTNPDPETRQKAALRLYILEGDGSAAALVKLYSKSNDLMIKKIVIQSLGNRGAGEQLATIAQTEQSPELRQMANEGIKQLKGNIVKLELTDGEKLNRLELIGKAQLLYEQAKEAPDSHEIELRSAKDLQGRMPPPPPPPPPPSDAMTVAAGQEFKPIVGDRGESMFDLLREAVDANMRRDTSFFERVLDEDYKETGPSGETLNKAQAIAEVKRLDYAIKKFEFDDLSVSGAENSAFATFLGTVYFQTNGHDSTAQFRYTVNFIKRNGQLKIAAIHMTQKH
jgi:hypothetical protein